MRKLVILYNSSGHFEIKNNPKEPVAKVIRLLEKALRIKKEELRLKS